MTWSCSTASRARCHQAGASSTHTAGGALRPDADGTITIDGAEVSRTDGDLPTALAAPGSTVRHHLAEHAPGYVFVHAGVVSADGVGIVIPGSGFSGKTMLVAELARAGATN